MPRPPNKPKPKLGGKRPGAGRPKGSRNKLTFDLKAALQKHAPELVKGILELTKSEDPRVRAIAIKECFDRGFGKAAQVVAGDADQPLEVRINIVKQEKSDS